MKMVAEIRRPLRENGQVEKIIRPRAVLCNITDIWKMGGKRRAREWKWK